MKVLVTGSGGFIGKNLVARLECDKSFTVLAHTRDRSSEWLEHALRCCDGIVHLAGVNRPSDDGLFMQVNCGFTEQLLQALKRQGNRCHIIAASSIQACQSNPYGKSKKAMEEELFLYGDSTGAKVTIYRLPNVFGKWCKTHYNSAVATFCHQIARGESIKIDDAQRTLRLVYIDDVVDEFIRALRGIPTIAPDGFCVVPIEHDIRLGELAEKLRGFRRDSAAQGVPCSGDPLEKKLYSTYLSYLPEGDFAHPLDMKKDERGYFAEALKNPCFGQVSVSLTKPGVTRGNHWHHTKAEKFLVVSGSAAIRLRKIGSKEALVYEVSGERPEAVDIPPGTTHAIQNTGETDLITVIWCNELFDPQNQDVYFEEV